MRRKRSAGIASSAGTAQRDWADHGIAGQNENGDPYTVDDLPSASATCEQQTVGIDFRTPGAVQASAPSSSSLVVEYDALDLDAVTGAGSPLVVVLDTRRNYHSVSWTGEIYGKLEDDAESHFPPGRCACDSGGDCDRPGG